MEESIKFRIGDIMAESETITLPEIDWQDVAYANIIIDHTGDISSYKIIMCDGAVYEDEENVGD